MRTCSAYSAISHSLQQRHQANSRYLPDRRGLYAPLFSGHPRCRRNLKSQACFLATPVPWTKWIQIGRLLHLLQIHWFLMQRSHRRPDFCKFGKYPGPCLDTYRTTELPGTQRWYGVSIYIYYYNLRIYLRYSVQANTKAVLKIPVSAE